MTPHCRPLGHGIHLIDTGFHRPDFDAAYLLTENGRAAFIDTGTNHAVPRLMDALQAQGLAAEAVDWVIVTHVHLDHAGGAGRLMQEVPNAKLVVHPRGAPHMINPRVLSLSARGVYGDEEFDRSYGEIVPVPRRRIIQTRDEGELTLAGRSLKFLHTPGHARHHHCIWDERTRGFFTGDTFGLSYREFDSAQGSWLTPSTTPVQFDPVPLRHSVQRMLDMQPEAMYLTHFGGVRHVQQLGRQFLAQLDDIVSLGRELAETPGRHLALKLGLAKLMQRHAEIAVGQAAAAQVASLMALDIELNAQGMGIWLDKYQSDLAAPSAK
jgi:glyoxylase-like metal-dependent hydrolase (beta-lactamase superfamily II)